MRNYTGGWNIDLFLTIPLIKVNQENSNYNTNDIMSFRVQLRKCIFVEDYTSYVDSTWPAICN